MLLPLINSQSNVYLDDFLAVMVFCVFLIRLYGSCPRTWLRSLSQTTNDSERWRLRSFDFFSFMCCLPHRRARTFPLPVTRKRLAAACGDGGSGCANQCLTHWHALCVLSLASTTSGCCCKDGAYERLVSCCAH